MPGFLLIDGAAHPVALIRRDGRYLIAQDDAPPAEAVAVRDGDRVWVHLDGAAHELIWRDEISHFAGDAATDADRQASAPMPGVVVSIAVQAGDVVRAGDALLVIESMKLETTLKASRDGVVEAVHVVTGESFERGAALVTLKAEDV